MLPPIQLNGWKETAFLDMCESTAEFLHRAKVYYNGTEYPTQSGQRVMLKSVGGRGMGLNVLNRVLSMAFSTVLAMWRSWLINESTRITGSDNLPSRLHRELVVLGNMRALKVEPKHSELEAYMSMLLAIVYPGIEYYKDKVFLYADVIAADLVKMDMSQIYGVAVEQQLQALGIYDGHADDEGDSDDDGFDHYAGVMQSLEFYTGTVPGESCIAKKGWAPEALITPRIFFVHKCVPY